MTGRKRFILSIILVFICFALFIVYQSYHLYNDKAQRTTESLMNQYFRLSGKNPDAAKRALQLVLERDPRHPVALRELGYWYLRQGDTRAALNQFKLAYQFNPQDKNVAHQLSQLYDMLGVKSDVIHNEVSLQDAQLIAKSSAVAYQPSYAYLFDESYNVIKPERLPTLVSAERTVISFPVEANAPSQPAAPVISHHDQLLNVYYQNRITHPDIAWEAINTLLAYYPNDVIALKEAGYFALSHQRNATSVKYFVRAYQLSHDPQLALQVGYILDGLNQKRRAYHYFSLATINPDLKERMKAELAMTNLRGSQTLFLPKPYFANILFYPFYRSRFKLMIYPVIARVGVMLNEKYQAAAYIIYRRTSDNKSYGSGVLPQIYEDNAAITSLGLQVTPSPKVPIMVFMEAGKAVDLVYKNRARWRNDFRTGLVYYNEWGKGARYTFKPRLSAIPNMDIYADLIYFSRYINTIGTMRARPGLEVFRYGSTSLNFYWKVFLSEDQSREFYNNILETGPSVAFTLSDRYNLTLRYECLTGYYLPSGSPTPNPFGPKYHNNMIFLDTYAGF